MNKWTNERLGCGLTSDGWRIGTGLLRALSVLTVLIQFGCQGVPVDPPPTRCDPGDCDDGVFCNGVEFCENDECFDGEPPCSSIQTCKEDTDECVNNVSPPCSDASCDDGVFCNGVEFCEDGECFDGDLPCDEGQDCNEVDRRCSGEQVVSNFAESDEGWRVLGGNFPGLTKPTWNPGVASVESRGEVHWIAPAKFLGVKPQFFGGTITFELEADGRCYTSRGRGQLRLTGAGTTLIWGTTEGDLFYNFPRMTFSAVLNETHVWIDESTGLRASGEQIRSVVGNLQGFEILGVPELCNENQSRSQLFAVRFEAIEIPPPHPCTTNADCDDDVFCNGEEFCEEGECFEGELPCDEGLACNEVNRRCSGEQVVSNFAGSDEGWQVLGGNFPGLTKPTWNPGVVSVESRGEVHWIAPAKFLGAKPQFFGGTITFELEADGRCYTSRGRGQLRLTGAGTTLIWGTTEGDLFYNFPRMTFSAVLNETHVWIDESTGLRASGEQIRSVVGNLQGFEILGVPELCNENQSRSQLFAVRFEAIEAPPTPPCTTNAICDDGVFCNGAETCQGGRCIAGATPCPNSGACNEQAKSCGACTSNAACDDGVYCNGVETCQSGRCVAGTAPCPNSGACNEQAKSCGACTSNAACDDGVYCNGAETCQAGRCVAGTSPCPNSGACNEQSKSCGGCTSNAACDDGVFCNGTETCVGSVCKAGSPVNCNDGIACTVDSCNEATDSCVRAPVDSLCSNGQYCDGVETCNPNIGCQSGVSPCPASQYCAEGNDTCVACLVDAHCDNGLFCNGTETCQGGQCIAGANPCAANQACTEDTRSCDIIIVPFLPPTNLTAIRDDSTPWLDVVVCWMDNSSNETHFVVQRREHGSSNWNRVCEVTANQTCCTDRNGLVAGTTYWYRVRGKIEDGQGNIFSEWSNEEAARPRHTSVAPPNNLVAQRDDSTAELDVLVTWRDNSDNETGFIVWRRRDDAAEWKRVGDVGPNVTIFIDPRDRDPASDAGNLVAGKKYWYKVRAKIEDIEGNYFSAWSNEEAAIPR